MTDKETLSLAVGWLLMYANDNGGWTPEQIAEDLARDFSADNRQVQDVIRRAVGPRPIKQGWDLP